MFISGHTHTLKNLDGICSHGEARIGDSTTSIGLQPNV